jgi:hypothetical protein
MMQPAQDFSGRHARISRQLVLAQPHSNSFRAGVLSGDLLIGPGATIATRERNKSQRLLHTFSNSTGFRHGFVLMIAINAVA